MSKYLTRKQVAECYPISFSHLAHMASQGRGIRYRIIGKNAIYHVDDVEAWLESKVIEPRRMKGRRKHKRLGDAPSVPPKEFQISQACLQAARTRFPGYDIEALEHEWRNAALKKGDRPKDADSAFLGWTAIYVKNHPLPYGGTF